MGNWNQDSSGLSDEDMDQSLQQDIAAANFAASGGDLGNYTFGGNFVNDADNSGYTGTSTSMNQAVADMQSLFNTQRGITASNPYGKEGFFSRVLGIDPSKIDYSGNMDLNTRMGIASNQFSKYMNPQNVKGQIGYNPAYDTAEKGKLRAGVQDENYQTVYGPVMEQARKQGTGEMLARGAMGLFGGPIGMALAQLGTKEYGLPGVTGFDSFDPNNPNPGGGILGQFLGGLNPTQAKEALVGAFAPVAPAPTPTQIGSVTPSQYETRADIIARTSQHPLTGETTGSLFSSRPQSLPATGTPTGVGMTVNTEFGPMSVPESTMSVAGYNELSPVEKMAVQSAIQETKPQASVETQQLAGSFFDSLFRDPMISPEAREILKEKGMTIDDLFAPKTPTPESEKPDIMDLIQGATQTSALGGPATANQYAQVDYSNLSNVGGNMYQAGQQKSAFDSFLETFGMKEAGRRPSGQIYSPAGKNKSFFDYIGFGQ